MISIKEMYRKVDVTLETLPLEALEELDGFLEQLRSKYTAKPQQQIVKLGGLWQEIPLDIEDDDIRMLRKRVTDSLSRET